MNEKSLEKKNRPEKEQDNNEQKYVFDDWTLEM